MLEEERKKLIAYIIVNDSTYDYSAVDFKYYHDNDLLALKRRIETEMQNKFKPMEEEDGLQPSITT